MRWLLEAKDSEGLFDTWKVYLSSYVNKPWLYSISMAKWWSMCIDDNNNNFPMNVNTKARKRISFTPIMLSTAHLTQPRSPFVLWTAPTTSSSATSAGSQERNSPETSSSTISFASPRTAWAVTSQGQSCRDRSVRITEQMSRIRTTRTVIRNL